MEKKFYSKGMSFIPKDEVSAEAVSKLNKIMEEKKERLNKLVENYRAGNLVRQQ